MNGNEKPPQSLGSSTVSSYNCALLPIITSARITMRKRFLLSIAFAGFCFLAACGIKGSLTLPPKSPDAADTVSPAAPPVKSAPATTPGEEL